MVHRPARATCPPSRRSPPSAILRERLPDLKVRVVNVVDLMRLQPETRAPARPLRPRVRLAVHARPADRLRLPRLPVADPPAHLPAHEPRQPARARLQGGGHDDDAVRHGHAQRPRPLPPRDRRDRPRPGPRARGPPTLRQEMEDDALRCRAWTREHGEDRPEVRDWTWPSGRAVTVLVLNAGSTSLKLHLVAVRGVERVRTWSRASTRGCDAVGHRVVHGGSRFREPVLVDDEVTAAIRELTPLAPFHNAPALRTLERGAGARSPTSRTSPSSTPRSTRRCPTRRRDYAVPAAVASSGACAATASTGCRWSGRPACAPVPGRTGGCGWSSATWAAARR